MAGRAPHRRTGPKAALATMLVAGSLLTGCSGDPERAASSTTAPQPPGSASPTTAETPAPTPTSPAAAPPAPTSPAPTTSPTATPTAPPSGADPVIRRIGDAQWKRMLAAGVWREGCPVGRSGLRRVELTFHRLHGGFGRGALVVNADVAESVARIFSRVFDARFPIERMRPIEAYGGDDLASMKDDNTSAFNCRKPDQANSPSAKSPHANGRAVDINPYRNPWTDPRCHCWRPSATYAEQPRTAPGTITKGSAVWRIFTREGWIWQDIAVTDYMHFDTGYPSVPFAPGT